MLQNRIDVHEQPHNIVAKRAPAEDEHRFLTFLVAPKFSENYSNNEHNENYSKYSDL